MRGNEFLDKMELIDPAYIEAADAAPKAGRKIWTGWRAAVAACICLVVLTGTAAAVSGGGTWLAVMFTGEDVKSDVPVSGYILGAEIRKFPVSELSEEVPTVVYSNGSPHLWCKHFSSAEEAWEFIGLDSLKKLDWDIGEHEDTTVFIEGDRNGAVTEIIINTRYRLDDIVLQAFTSIYTEYWDGEAGEWRFFAMEEVEYAESFYTTPSGKQCQIISTSPPLYGRLMMDGHLTDNGIFYSWDVNYGSEQDAVRAEELLHQWADMF